MYPILLDWNGWVVPAWHFFYFLAALSAYGTLVAFARRLDPNLERDPFLPRVYTVGYACGYLGARGLSLLVEGWPPTLGQTLHELVTLGSMTFYGGALGAGVGCLAYTSWVRRSPWQVMDIAIPAGLVGLGVGRIGCFLNGDDYGLPLPEEQLASPPWWALINPVLEDNLPRYPVQLIEMAMGLTSAALLWYWSQKVHRRLGPGALGLVGAGLYAVFRIGIEEFRGDDRGWLWDPWWSTSRIISAVLIVTLAGLWVVRPRKSR